MAKSFKDLRKNIGEWQSPTGGWGSSVPAGHTAHTTDRMSVRTDLSAKAKRPSVKQLKKMTFTSAERINKGIHGFTLNDPNLI